MYNIISLWLRRNDMYNSISLWFRWNDMNNITSLWLRWNDVCGFMKGFISTHPIILNSYKSTNISREHKAWN